MRKMIASKCKCIFTVLFSYKTPITFFFFLLPLGVSGKQVVNSTLVSALSDFHGAVSSLKKGLAAPIEWKEKNELT